MATEAEEIRGIGHSVRRKEDDRFLRGRGQYVGDFRIAGTREVAFVRSPVAHARLRHIHIPEEFRNAVFTAEDLMGVKPIVSAPPLKGFRYSVEPILATGKLRYVGEMVAMCVAATRADALGPDASGAVSGSREVDGVVDGHVVGRTALPAIAGDAIHAKHTDRVAAIATCAALAQSQNAVVIGTAGRKRADAGGVDGHGTTGAAARAVSRCAE